MKLTVYTQKSREGAYVYFIKTKYPLFDITPPPKKKEKTTQARSHKLTEINKELYYYEIGYLIREFEGQYQKCLTFRC